MEALLDLTDIGGISLPPLQGSENAVAFGTKRRAVVLARAWELLAEMTCFPHEQRAQGIMLLGRLFQHTAAAWWIRHGVQSIHDLMMLELRPDPVPSKPWSPDATATLATPSSPIGVIVNASTPITAPATSHTPSGPGNDFILSFGKHKGKRLAEVPRGYLHYLAAQLDPTHHASQPIRAYLCIDK
jgi:hypothetical protein